MRNYKQIIFIITLFVTSCFTSTYAQVESIRWYSIEQAEALLKKEKRKIFIDVFTSWCGVCKNMDNATFTQQHIVRYLNENYYPVKLDAEQRNDINFKSKTYHFVTQSNVGFNELAAEFLKGQLSFPTIVFLDEHLNLIQAIQGFRPPEQFEKIMTYFGEDNHKKVPWNKYEKSYQPIKNR